MLSAIPGTTYPLPWFSALPIGLSLSPSLEDGRWGFGFLEQNHDNRTPKGLVQGIDFLRKSILCKFDLAYIYRGFARARSL
jgi:hypothetical protein